MWANLFFSYINFMRNTSNLEKKHLFLLMILVQTVHTISLKQEHDTARLVQFIGAGYNIIEGNPEAEGRFDPGFRSPVFQYSYSQGKRTDDDKYLVPDQSYPRDTRSCSFSSEVSSILGTKSYQQELKTRVAVGLGYESFLLAASFSASVEFSRMKQEAKTTKNVNVRASSQCEAYAISIGLFKTLQLREDFKEGVKRSFKTGNWGDFIASYGTDFAYDIIFGGRATQQTTYTYQKAQLLKSMNIDVNVAAKASFAGFFGGVSVDFGLSKGERSMAQKEESFKQMFYLGGQPKGNNTIQWAKSVKEDPMPIFYSLQSLTTLFDKFLSFEEANNAKISWLKYMKSDYCKKVKCTEEVFDIDVKLPKLQTKNTHLIGKYEGMTDIDWKPFGMNLMNANIVKINYSYQKNGNEFISTYGFEVAVSNGIQIEYSGFRGIPHTHTQQFQIPEGQYITKLVGYYMDNKYFSHFIFYTNKGTFSNFIKGKETKRLYGYEALNIQKEWRVCGIIGKYSINRINEVGFYTRKTIFE